MADPGPALGQPIWNPIWYAFPIATRAMALAASGGGALAGPPAAEASSDQASWLDSATAPGDALSALAKILPGDSRLRPVAAESPGMGLELDSGDWEAVGDGEFELLEASIEVRTPMPVPQSTPPNPTAPPSPAWISDLPTPPSAAPATASAVPHQAPAAPPAAPLTAAPLTAAALTDAAVGGGNLPSTGPVAFGLRLNRSTHSPGEPVVPGRPAPLPTPFSQRAAAVPNQPSLLSASGPFESLKTTLGPGSSPVVAIVDRPPLRSADGLSGQENRPFDRPAPGPSGPGGAGRPLTPTPGAEPGAETGAETPVARIHGAGLPSTSGGQPPAEFGGSGQAFSEPDGGDSSPVSARTVPGREEPSADPPALPGFGASGPSASGVSTSSTGAPRSGAPDSTGPRTPLAAASASVVIDPPPERLTLPPRELVLDIPSSQEGSSVASIHIRDANGGVEISVRTPDAQLSSSLQESLPDLVSRLESRGFDAQATAGGGGEGDQPSEGQADPHPDGRPGQDSRAPDDGRQPRGQPRESRRERLTRWQSTLGAAARP